MVLDVMTLATLADGVVGSVVGSSGLSPSPQAENASAAASSGRDRRIVWCKLGERMVSPGTGGPGACEGACRPNAEDDLTGGGHGGITWGSPAGSHGGWGG